MVHKPKDDAALTPDVDPRRYWLEENAAAFAAQAAWNARHPHPLAEILIDPKSFRYLSS